MILKSVDTKRDLTKYQEYGHKAEKQMAFYLKRAFQDSEDIYVINDLRLEMHGDFAQIDHLVVHRFGFFIIESKSVTGQVLVNEYGEWARKYANQTRGMPSPIMQAMRQADFLCKLLAKESDNLLRKKWILKTEIPAFKFDVLVAVSDDGLIKRHGRAKLPEVHKADQIVEAIKALRKNYISENKNLLSTKVNHQFADSTMRNIIQFLLKAHAPKQPKPAESMSHDISVLKKIYGRPVKAPDAKTCCKCSSQNVEVTYGKYGYYFKCRDCKGNTSIKLSCNSSACKPRIQKRGDHFYKVCASCNTSELYYVNQLVKECT